MIEAGGTAWGSLDMVQVRGKTMAAADLETLCRGWAEAASVSRATLIVVNDRFDVAVAAEADGVHVGQRDLPPAAIREHAPPGFVIGVSAHDGGELARAAGEADYAGLGAFYASRTKPEAVLLDRDRLDLRAAVREAAIPVLAIGGITAARVGEVLATVPVSGVAVSHAIQGAADPAAAIRDLRSELDRAWTERQATQRVE